MPAKKVYLVGYRFPININITQVDAKIIEGKLYMETFGTLGKWSPIRLLVSPFWSRYKLIEDVINLENGNLERTTAFVLDFLNAHEEGPKFKVVSAHTHEMKWLAIWTYGLLVKEVLVFFELPFTGVERTTGFINEWKRDFLAVSGAPEKLVKNMKWFNENKT